jgi:hypothetical protein
VDYCFSGINTINKEILSLRTIVFNTNRLTCKGTCKSQCVNVTYCNQHGFVLGKSCIMCKTDEIFVNSICQKCPFNSIYVNNKCKCNIANQIIVNNACVCPNSYIFQNNKCIICSVNSIPDANKTKCQCVDGYLLVNRSCQIVTSCPDLAVYNIFTKRCECSANSVLVGNRCQCLDKAIQSLTGCVVCLDNSIPNFSKTQC